MVLACLLPDINRQSWFSLLTNDGKKKPSASARGREREDKRGSTRQLTLTFVRRERRPAGFDSAPAAVVIVQTVINQRAYFTLVSFCQAAKKNKRLKYLRLELSLSGRDGGLATWEPDTFADGAESSLAADGDYLWFCWRNRKA